MKAVFSVVCLLTVGRPHLININDALDLTIQGHLPSVQKPYWP